jgi:uncharacterized protein (TIGR03086 family)
MIARDTMLLPIYRSAVRQFDLRVRAVRPAQWALSTPDGDWDVRRLVRHVIAGQAAAPALLGGRAPENAPPDSSASPEDLASGWAAAAAAAVAALDAVPADQQVDLPDGRTTAATLGWRLATELTVHGWDLARAINAPDEFPNDLLAHVLEHAKSNAATWFPAARYQPPIPVPGCTDDLTELLALTGRNRWWRRS